jgi:hypothetical protein
MNFQLLGSAIPHDAGQLDRQFDSLNALRPAFASRRTSEMQTVYIHDCLLGAKTQLCVKIISREMWYIYIYSTHSMCFALTELLVTYT